MTAHDPGATRYSPLKQIDVAMCPSAKGLEHFTVAACSEAIPVWLTVYVSECRERRILH